MSQAIWATIIPSSTSGNQLATLLNGFKDAVVSGFSGTSRPSQLQAGGYWVDTTNDGTGFWDVKLYDGAQDILLFTINKNTGTSSITGAASLFEILKTSADSVGPYLKLTKERIANNGQVLPNDVLGETRFYGTQDDGNETLQAAIAAISRDTVTVSAQGSAILFKAINLGEAALSEMMRLQDGKLGIGTSSPSESLHVKGTGFKVEKNSDDVNGVSVVLHKKRIAGSGGVQSGDYLAIVKMDSRSDVGSDITGAQIEVSATENHTSVNQGTKIEIKTKDNGSNALSSKMIIDSNGVTIPTLHVTNLVAGSVTELEDSNILLNKGGTQASANAQVAGFTVEMSDATHARLGYDSTKATKFKLGLLGSEVGIVDESTAQSLTNKTITSLVGMDAGKHGTLAALTTYALTSGDGKLCFATDVGRLYYTYGTNLIELERTMIANAGSEIPVTDLDTTVDNHTPPANAIGFIIQADEENTNPIRYALGTGNASSTNGIKLLPGVTQEKQNYNGVVSVIAIATAAVPTPTNQKYNLQWLIRN